MPKVNALYYEERKNFIIECAYRVLENKPMCELTMRDVIKESGFSQGTIYNYYKSIEEVLSVIICRYMLHMRQELSDCIASSGDFYDCYDRICDRMICLHQENADLFEGMLGKISYSAMPRDNEDILYDVYQAGEDLNNIIIELLKKGIADGIIREDLNLCVTVFYLWSGIGQIIVFSHNKKQYIEEQFHMTRQDYMKQGFELIIRSILREEQTH